MTTASARSSIPPKAVHAVIPKDIFPADLRARKRDQDRLDKVRALADPARPVTVTHWLAPQPAKASRRGGPTASPGEPGATQP